MEQILNQYLELKKLAWNERTFKTESARLSKHIDYVDGNPQTLYKAIYDNVSPYTFVSLWNRYIEVYDLVDRQNNPYRQFKKQNARLFKGYYHRKAVPMTFEEAKERISFIQDQEVRAKALDLLSTGLRFAESQTESEGFVLGKGNKIRKVFRPKGTSPVIFSRSYDTFNRGLKSVGLTSHMLRKLAATKLSRMGMKEQDLCKTFGWTSFETARFYLQPMEDEKIQSMMERL